jgi:hypothetical protein
MIASVMYFIVAGLYCFRGKSRNAMRNATTPGDGEDGCLGREQRIDQRAGQEAEDQGSGSSSSEPSACLMGLKSEGKSPCAPRGKFL